MNQTSQQSIQMFIRDEISICFTILIQTLSEMIPLLQTYQQTSETKNLILSKMDDILEKCSIESIPLYRSSQIIQPNDKFSWNLSTREFILQKPYLYQDQIQSLLNPYQPQKGALLEQYYYQLLTHYQSIQTQYLTIVS